MKGIVFTEFLDFVAETHGRDMADDVIDDCQLPSGGAYTSVGTYDYTEMQMLVAGLARRTGDKAPDILKRYGRYLCQRFVEIFPGFFRRNACLFDFLGSVDGYIHVEVLKLYPDAQFPSFQVHARDDSALQLDYRSCRPLAALAEGLILGASDYFREPVGIKQKRYEDPNGGFVRFTIRHVP